MVDWKFSWASRCDVDWKFSWASRCDMECRMERVIAVMGPCDNCAVGNEASRLMVEQLAKNEGRKP